MGRIKIGKIFLHEIQNKNKISLKTVKQAICEEENFLNLFL